MVPDAATVWEKKQLPWDDVFSFVREVRLRGRTT
jgi:hypothetical protein